MYEPLDEVEKELSATLKHVVDSIKCLKWPTENAKEDHRSNRFLNSLHESATWVKTRLKLGRNDDDDLDPVSAKQEEFWRRLLVTLPKREAETVDTGDRVEDPDRAIRSLQSLTSLQSNASETNELIRVERTENSNLFNRRHFDNVHARTKPKIVHVVRPQPRRTSDIPKTDNTEENQVPDANTQSTTDVSNLRLKDVGQNLGNTELISGACSDAKLISGACSDAKLIAGACSDAKLISGACSDAKLIPGACSDAKLIAGACSDVKLIAGACSDAKLIAGACSDVKLIAGACSDAKLIAGACSDVKLIAGACSDAKLIAGACSDVKLIAGACSDGKQTISSSTTDDIDSDVVCASPKKNVKQMKLNIGFEGENVEIVC